MRNEFRVHIYADGANKEQMLKNHAQGLVKGFTTNPTLMAKAGIRDYERFARDILTTIRDLPVSFEVFSDEFPEMTRQARKISSWGPNVNVKIPIMNTRAESALPLIQGLLSEGLKLNITAVFTIQQMKNLRELLEPKDDVIVSVFAGRIADTGIDPVPLMREAVELFKDLPHAKVLWASPREVLNIYQADDCGCDIITVTDDLIKKLAFKDKDLGQFSKETVEMFYRDSIEAGFQL